MIAVGSTLIFAFGLAIVTHTHTHAHTFIEVFSKPTLAVTNVAIIRRQSVVYQYGKNLLVIWLR